MSFSITPYGVLAHIPVYEIGGRLYTDLSWSLSQPRIEPGKEHGLLLPLSPRPHPQLSHVYDCGASFGAARGMLRVISKAQLGVRATPANDTQRHSTSSPWRTIYLAVYDQDPKLEPSGIDNSGYPIRFPEHHMNRFTGAHGLWLGGIERHGGRDSNNFRCRIKYNAPSKALSSYKEVLLQVGQCTRGRQYTSETPYWANIKHLERRMYMNEDEGRKYRDLHNRHKCPEDHVENWRNMRKDFSSICHRRNWDEEWLFTLGFSPCPNDPDVDLVLTELSCKELAHFHLGPQEPSIKSQSDVDCVSYCFI